VLFQVSEFLEPIGMFHRNFPWAHYSTSDLDLFILLPLPAESGYDAAALSPYAFGMDAFFALQFVLEHWRINELP
jgi:hypothetical protein